MKQMPLVVRAFPAIKGKDETMKLVEELTQRRTSEMDAFYRKWCSIGPTRIEVRQRSDSAGSFCATNRGQVL